MHLAHTDFSNIKQHNITHNTPKRLRKSFANMGYCISYINTRELHWLGIASRGVLQIGASHFYTTPAQARNWDQGKFMTAEVDRMGAIGVYVCSVVCTMNISKGCLDNKFVKCVDLSLIHKTMKIIVLLFLIFLLNSGPI